jgi:lipopolysaccharide export system permease protein
MFVTSTLGRYFAKQFVFTTLAVLLGVYLLVLVIDYIELSRMTANVASASATAVARVSFLRIPQIIERLLPFCVQIGTMVCYLALSRRLELVVARSSGISAWQFVSPALLGALALGVIATTLYSPLSAAMQEQAIIEENSLYPDRASLRNASGFWLNQVTPEGQSIINAANSQAEGTRLGGVSVFRFDTDNRFVERIEAAEAELEAGFWRMKNVRRYRVNELVSDEDSYRLTTNLTREQVRETFVVPESVSFWQLPDYIATSANSGLATAGYRYQYEKLKAQPFMLVAMVFLAASVSLRFFRLGGVQTMVLSGIGGGFLLYVLSKVTEDLSKAELMHPVAAAWLPVFVGGLAGFLVLLNQEDG